MPHNPTGRREDASTLTGGGTLLLSGVPEA
jgi:hypothetical protein